MHNNVFDVLEKIVNSPRLLSRFLELDTIDEIYHYCQKLKCDCTKEDFKNDICEMLNLFFDDDMDAEKLSDLEMSYVAGGAKAKIFNKTVAGALSVLMAGSSMNIASAQSAVAVEPSAKPSFRQRVSNFWQNNKKAILTVLGVAATVAVVTLSVVYFGQKGKTLRTNANDDLAKLKKANTALQNANEAVSNAATALHDNPGDANLQSALRGAQQVEAQQKLQFDTAVKALGGLKEDETVDDIYKRYHYNSTNNALTDPESTWINARTFLKHWYKGNSKSKLKGLGLLGSVIGSIGTAWNLIDTGFEKLSKFSKRISYVSNLKYHAKSIGDSISESYKKWLRKLEPPKDLNLKDVPEKISSLFEKIKGQAKAKIQIRAAIENILRERDYMERIGEEYSHGDVLYFIGPSGVGKTMMAEGLARYNILTTHPDVYFVSASDVDPDSRQSVIDQLFGGSPYSYSGGYSGNCENLSPIINKQRSLVKFLTDNPGGIVIVDEYDKMWTKSLDEIFRTIVDRGELRVGSQTINCKGTIFILTSNESSASILGGNQDSTASVEHDDGTGSRTVVKHDKSFLNRIKPIEFENLSQEDYANIARDEYQFYLTDYWAIDDVCGLNLVIDEKCLKNIAIVTEKVNEGARYIKKLRGDLFLEISLTVYAMESVFGKDCMRGQQLFVEFDTETESFTLKNKHGQVLNSVEGLQDIIMEAQGKSDEDAKTGDNKPEDSNDAKVDDASSESDKPKTDGDEPIKEKAEESEKMKTDVEPSKPEEKLKKEDSPAQQPEATVEPPKPEEKLKKEDSPAQQPKATVEPPKPEEKLKKEDSPAQQPKATVEPQKPEGKPKKEDSPAQQPEATVEPQKPEEKLKKEDSPAQQPKATVEPPKPEEKLKKEDRKPATTPTVTPPAKSDTPKQSTTKPTTVKSKPTTTAKTVTPKQNTKKATAKIRKNASPLTH